MPLSQAKFVRQQNILRYERELSIAPVGPRRKMLVSLMTEERAKFPPRAQDRGLSA